MSMFRFVSVSSALLLLYSMIRLYMIPSVPSWNNIHTPVGFILAALSCGLGFILVFTGISKQANKKILLILGLLLIAAAINTILYNSLPYKQLTYLFFLRLILSISAIMIISGKYFLIIPNKSGTWAVIIFVIITLSEIMNRYIFFLSFEKSGL
jgi:DMSO reductase anchor subunit